MSILTIQKRGQMKANDPAITRTLDCAVGRVVWVIVFVISSLKRRNYEKKISTK